MHTSGTRALCAITVALSIFCSPTPLHADTPKPEADALYKKALAAQTGKGATLDLARGKSLMTEAAEAGSTAAMNRLGDMYRIPDGGVPIDLAQARSWYDKSAAADDSYGCLWSANLPDKALARDEENKRFAHAFKVAQAAMKNGDGNGSFVMAVFCMTGNGVPKNPDLAVQALQQADADGNVYATRELASSYAHGDGLPKDAAKAFALYTKAAESSLSINLMDLGICYDSGIGVAKDYAKALDYYLQAADRGSPRCMTNAGQMLTEGQGAPKDVAKAATLYQKAADLGWPPAMYYLGMAYDTGSGVARNHDTAVTWIKKSAAKANPRAKKYLADHQIPAE